MGLNPLKKDGTICEVNPCHKQKYEKFRYLQPKRPKNISKRHIKGEKAFHILKTVSQFYKIKSQFYKTATQFYKIASKFYVFRTRSVWFLWPPFLFSRPCLWSIEGELTCLRWYTNGKRMGVTHQQQKRVFRDFLFFNKIAEEPQKQE